jgi:hypothetical protein
MAYGNFPTIEFDTMADALEPDALGTRSKYVIIKNDELRAGRWTYHFWDGTELNPIFAGGEIDSDLFALLGRDINEFTGKVYAIHGFGTTYSFLGGPPATIALCQDCYYAQTNEDEPEEDPVYEFLHRNAANNSAVFLDNGVIKFLVSNGEPSTGPNQPQPFIEAARIDNDGSFVSKRKTVSYNSDQSAQLSDLGKIVYLDGTDEEVTYTIDPSLFEGITFCIRCIDDTHPVNVSSDLIEAKSLEDKISIALTKREVLNLYCDGEKLIEL